MAERKVEVAIIGAGTAGLAAYRMVREHTDRLVLIEQGPGGTTCARVGCMPSKLLIAAADARHHVETASEFGIRTGPSTVDGIAVMRRVQSLRDRFVGGVEKIVAGLPEQIEAPGLWRGIGFRIGSRNLASGFGWFLSFGSTQVGHSAEPEIDRTAALRAEVADG